MCHGGKISIEVRTVQHNAGLIATLVRGAGIALTIQLASAGANYLTRILLARWLGAAEFGIFEYVTTLSLVLSFIAGLGLSNVVLRFISEYSVQQDWAKLRGVIWGSWWQTALVGVGLAGIGTAALLWLPIRLSVPILPLVLGLWLVPLVALMKLQLEMLRAVRRIALAYAPSLVVYPLLLLLGISIWLQFQSQLTSTGAIGIAWGTMLLILIVQLTLFQRGLPSGVHQTKSEYATRQWLAVALPLLFIDGSFLVLNQADTLMIGAFLNPTSVGLYSAAFKTAEWVRFILAAVNAIAAPMFASLYAQGNRAELQHLVSVIARWMFYPALAMAIGLLIFADPILGLFGPEFVGAKWAMIALMVGQLVNVGAGSVGYLLTMTGHQNQCAMVVGWSGLLNILLNWISIPQLGILGAAIATAISMSLWNIWMNRLVVKYLDVNPSIVAAIRNP